MRLVLTLLFHFISLSIGCQSLSSFSTTRALVIGISDYQGEKIPDLQFAHKDAEAFAAWLHSTAGAGLPPGDVKLLTNEKAKNGNIIAELSWLIDESKAGDKVIIYFSGHGDVENVTKFQDGFLLGYDTPPTAYMAGAISVFHFRRIINSLSEEGVEVITILDACRAGKLAGSEFGGAQATTAALKEQFANEIKILSCQPDEYSLEGKEWGGGRGCFSYHLVDGLYGLADRDNNFSVNLMELRNYLEMNVSREAAPQSQVPFTVGNPKTHLSAVDKSWVTALKTKKAEQLAALKEIKSKGIEDLILANQDTSVLELYAEFLAAIDRNDLMSPDSASADFYFRQLIENPEIEPLHNYMKRNFAAALMNEAQEVTNKVLKTDPQVISDTWSRPFVYDHIPGYLKRAAEILGEDHFIYDQLKAKQYYFESKYYRQENFPELTSDSLISIQLRTLEEALKYDSAAAYVYVDLALNYYYKTSRFDKAVQYGEKALEVSPNWVFALYAAGTVYRPSNLELGEPHLLKALELDSTFLPLYQEISMHYMSAGHIIEAKEYAEKYVQKIQKLIETHPEKVPALYYTYLGSELCKLERFDEAEAALLKAEQLTRQQDLAVYQWLTAVYRDKGQFNKAITTLKKETELGGSVSAYFRMSSLYLFLNQPLNAEEALKKAQSIFPENQFIGLLLGNTYQYYLKDFTKAEETYLTAIEQGLSLYSTGSFSGFIPYLRSELINLYLSTGQNKKAEPLFPQVIEAFSSRKDPFALGYLGRAYLEIGAKDSMELMVNDILEQYPDNPIYYFVASYLYHYSGNDKTAIDLLEQAFKKDLSFTNHFIWNLYFDLGDLKQSPEYISLMHKYFPEAYSNYLLHLKKQ